MEEERVLIRKIQKHGNRAAADALVRKYYDEIYKFVRRQMRNEGEALDITQETFIGLLQTIRYYNASKAGFRTWLYKIATNKVVDYYRSNSKKMLFEPFFLEEVEPIDESDFTQEIQDSIIAEKICNYVGELPSDIQKIFRLHIWGGYTFKEIANVLHLPESSVKSKYYRLIDLLRKEFSTYGS